MLSRRRFPVSAYAQARLRVGACRDSRARTGSHGGSVSAQLALALWVLVLPVLAFWVVCVGWGWVRFRWLVAGGCIHGFVVPCR